MEQYFFVSFATGSTLTAFREDGFKGGIVEVWYVHDVLDFIMQTQHIKWSNIFVKDDQPGSSQLEGLTGYLVCQNLFGAWRQ